MNSSMSISENIKDLKEKLSKDVSLVAVSKTKPISDLMQAYSAGQRIFGENKVQEMVEKWQQMPSDVAWHMIGHIQRNKVKYMAPFVSLIHGVDSLKLLREIQKEAIKNNRSIACLLQIKIATEESKFGLSEEEASAILESDEIKKLDHVKIIGFMGMATFTNNKVQLTQEFQRLKKYFEIHKNMHQLSTLSMGMSADYQLAIENGSNMVRVGSAIFGKRNYN